MESLARRSKIVVRKMQELEGRMYVEKGSGNVTRIKIGIVIERNWKRGKSTDDSTCVCGLLSRVAGGARRA